MWTPRLQRHPSFSVRHSLQGCIGRGVLLSRGKARPRGDETAEGYTQREECGIDLNRSADVRLANHELLDLEINSYNELKNDSRLFVLDPTNNYRGEFSSSALPPEPDCHAGAESVSASGTSRWRSGHGEGSGVIRRTGTFGGLAMMSMPQAFQGPSVGKELPGPIVSSQ